VLDPKRLADADQGGAWILDVWAPLLWSFRERLGELGFDAMTAAVLTNTLLQTVGAMAVAQVGRPPQQPPPSEDD
jgi:hypothetical protein